MTKSHLHSYAHCSTIHSSREMKTTQVFVSWWVDQENEVRIHNGVVFMHKNEWNPVTCNSMDDNRDHYVKSYKPGTEKHISCNLTHL
jgi:hypothetical protein